MPVIWETVEDIAEEMADRLGVYGAHPKEPQYEPCRCRVCFTSGLKSRIYQAIETERKLNFIADSFGKVS